MRTTIEMAREAAGDDWGLFQEYMPEIHRLAELVRADERARMAEQPKGRPVESDYTSQVAYTRALEAYCDALAEQPAQQQETEHIIHSNGRYSPLLTHMMNKRAESNVKQVIHLYDEPHPKPAQLPFGVGGGLVAIKTLLSRDPCVHANTAIQMIDAMLAEQPAPPPECQTEAEKTAYAFGWFKGLESVRQQPSQDDPDLQDKGPELVEQPAQRKPLTDVEKAVIDAARAAMDASTEANDGEGSIAISSELAASLSLCLDEYDRTIEAKLKEKNT